MGKIKPRCCAPPSVRYEAVNVMLLNEFLKEHKRVEAQQSTIQKQEAVIARLEKEVETVVAHPKVQDLEIERVRHQVQINSRDAQLVVRDR